MTDELAVAYDELHRLEFQLIEEQESQDARLLTMKTDTAIDLTLASVFDATVSSLEVTAVASQDDTELAPRKRPRMIVVSGSDNLP